MSDKREELLQAIFTILQTVDGVQECARNRDQLPGLKRPGILFLDGDEEARRDADGKGRPAYSPNRIILKPEIYLTMDSRKPKNAELGTDLNEFRGKVLGRLLTSTVLRDLCHNIFYAGCITDLAKGRDMLGQMGIAIEFTYELKPAEL